MIRRLSWMMMVALLAACSTKRPAADRTVAAPSASPSSRLAPAPAGTDNLAPIVTPGGAIRGQVASVNASGRFVVLSYPIGGLPALERRLNVYRNGLKVAELKITGPQRDNNIVADIMAGQCAPGDQVRED